MDGRLVEDVHFGLADTQDTLQILPDLPLHFRVKLVVIVAIERESLKVVGAPWPRGRGQIVQHLPREEDWREVVLFDLGVLEQFTGVELR